jgi:hypothetical protein
LIYEHPGARRAQCTHALLLPGSTPSPVDLASRRRRSSWFRVRQRGPAVRIHVRVQTDGCYVHQEFGAGRNAILFFPDNMIGSSDRWVLGRSPAGSYPFAPHSRHAAKAAPSCFPPVESIRATPTDTTLETSQSTPLPSTGASASASLGVGSLNSKGGGENTGDLDAPATQFVRKARLICRLQQAGPQCTVHLEHCVHHNFSNLLDLLPRLFHFLSASRSSRLCGDGTLEPYCEVAQITQRDCKG